MLKTLATTREPAARAGTIARAVALKGIPFQPQGLTAWRDALALAAVLNYIPYVGMAVMWVILVAVGLGTRKGIELILVPVGCYKVVNFLEGQLITPHFIGRAMTLNPFVIFLSNTFWLWAWGPIGGVIAVPSLLIGQSVLAHVLPSRPVKPRRPVRRTRDMSRREELLANAAQAIREQNAGKVDDEKRIPERLIPPGGAAPVKG